ncbi:MAG: glucose-6-phosphate isomerase, partial [Acidobacteriota bacterium]
MSSWDRYQRYVYASEELGLRLDISRMAFDDDFFTSFAPRLERAYDAMAALEGGAIANPDEDRRVGHYWLRASHLAPEVEMRQAIEQTVERVTSFAAAVHAGEVSPPGGGRFTDVLAIGIGGSALGPQLAADALGHPDRDAMALHFFDNTDPDGFDRVLATLGDRLATTLVMVVSKSGSTVETVNGLMVAQRAFRNRGLD